MQKGLFVFCKVSLSGFSTVLVSTFQVPCSWKPTNPGKSGQFYLPAPGFEACNTRATTGGAVLRRGGKPGSRRPVSPLLPLSQQAPRGACVLCDLSLSVAKFGVACGLLPAEVRAGSGVFAVFPTRGTEAGPGPGAVGLR